MYLDVHTHLTHPKFKDDLPQVLQRARQAQLDAIVVNGLDPKSNREILKMSKSEDIVLAACGIYPVNAAQDSIPEDFQLDIPRFCPDEEIMAIKQMAEKKQLAAVGECGMDGYWLGEDSFEQQEDVFRKLIQIAKDHDIPVIVHSRKLEKRTIEILKDTNCEKVVFHCFCGKFKLAKAASEFCKNWCFSIPCNAANSQSFQKMLRELPLDQILTETDAPYLAPVRGERNEPANVVGTIQLFSELRDISHEGAKITVYENFKRLFKEGWNSNTKDRI